VAAVASDPVSDWSNRYHSRLFFVLRIQTRQTPVGLEKHLDFGECDVYASFALSGIQYIAKWLYSEKIIYKDRKSKR